MDWRRWRRASCSDGRDVEAGGGFGGGAGCGEGESDGAVIEINRAPRSLGKTLVLFFSAHRFITKGHRFIDKIRSHSLPFHCLLHTWGRIPSTRCWKAPRTSGGRESKSATRAKARWPTVADRTWASLSRTRASSALSCSNRRLLYSSACVIQTRCGAQGSIADG